MQPSQTGFAEDQATFGRTSQERPSRLAKPVFFYRHAPGRSHRREFEVRKPHKAAGCRLQALVFPSSLRSTASSLTFGRSRIWGLQSFELVSDFDVRVSDLTPRPLPLPAASRIATIRETLLSRPKYRS